MRQLLQAILHSWHGVTHVLMLNLSLYQGKWYILEVATDELLEGLARTW